MTLCVLQQHNTGLQSSFQQVFCVSDEDSLNGADFSLEAGLKAAGDHRRGPGVKSTQVSGYLSQLYLFL